MEFRWHPILENLRCNEDGTEIYLKGRKMQIKQASTGGKHIHIYDRRITVLRIVCECWHGMPDTLDQAARRIDETAGDHYTNLHWGKQGLTQNTAKHRDYSKDLKITEAEYNEIEQFRASGEIQKELKKRGHSLKAWQNAMKKYGKN